MLECRKLPLDSMLVGLESRPSLAYAHGEF